MTTRSKKKKKKEIPVYLNDCYSASLLHLPRSHLTLDRELHNSAVHQISQIVPLNVSVSIKIQIPNIKSLLKCRVPSGVYSDSDVSGL